MEDFTLGKCDICGNEEEIFNQCCGVKVCFPCDYRFIGQCSVCQRDELNLELHCDCCEKVGTCMTILYCPYCEGIFCPDCLSINESPIICCYNESCEDRFWSEVSSDEDTVATSRSLPIS